VILPHNAPKIVNFVDDVTGKVLASCRASGTHILAPDLTPKEQEALFAWMKSGNLREMALSFGTEVATIPCHVERGSDGTIRRFMTIAENL